MICQTESFFAPYLKTKLFKILGEENHFLTSKDNSNQTLCTKWFISLHPEYLKSHIYSGEHLEKGTKMQVVKSLHNPKNTMGVLHHKIETSPPELQVFNFNTSKKIDNKCDSPACLLAHSPTCLSVQIHR